CTDVKNIGKNIRIPAGATSDPAAVERRDSRYLSQLAAYYDKLAAEAPPQAGKDIRLIVPAYQRLASSIANGNVQSPGKIDQQHLGELRVRGVRRAEPQVLGQRAGQHGSILLHPGPAPKRLPPGATRLGARGSGRGGHLAQVRGGVGVDVAGPGQLVSQLLA